MIKITNEEELKNCIEEIEKDKVVPHKTQNLLKDIEYDTEILKEEACESLDENFESEED